MTAERRFSSDAPTIRSFLTELGLEKYIKLFEDECIDFNNLVCLDEQDLKELGLV